MVSIAAKAEPRRRYSTQGLVGITAFTSHARNLKMVWHMQVTMASLIDPGSKIDVCKVDVTQRQSCGDFLGNTLPCTLSPGFRGMHDPSDLKSIL